MQYSLRDLVEEAKKLTAPAALDDAPQGSELL
jgi:hypothetical protein